MASKKISRNERFMLKGAMRKGGFDRWRLVADAFSVENGEEKTFFVEFFILNPMLSPETCVLGYKNRLGKTAADLQHALAGTESEKNILTEKYVQQSFVMVKAGVLGKNGRHVNSYFPGSALETGKNDFIVRVGGSAENSCLLTENSTRGSVLVRKEDLDAHPELLCDAGSIMWNLRFEKKVSFNPRYRSKGINWHCLGANTVYAGKILLDGHEYRVSAPSSFGYYDKCWGRDFVSPFIHLSSCNFTSQINGKKLMNSAFAVEGEFGGYLDINTNIEGKVLQFRAGKGKNYNSKYECTQAPENDGEVQLHWSISVSNKRNVVDIDIFCSTDEMYLRDYESPVGQRKILKVLGGGTGRGELKIYRKVKKNLELLEDVQVSGCVCEYGHSEFPQK